MSLAPLAVPDAENPDIAFDTEGPYACYQIQFFQSLHIERKGTRRRYEHSSFPQQCRYPFQSSPDLVSPESWMVPYMGWRSESFCSKYPLSLLEYLGNLLLCAGLELEQSGVES
jgi:hypothetical protein